MKEEGKQFLVSFLQEWDFSTAIQVSEIYCLKLIYMLKVQQITYGLEKITIEHESTAYGR